ncbi:MAG: hypothetical protein COT74_02150 [Bdellovibrionales bacterium CG10_big_fil_rev_8_21_14_0_10_45_34]|nr:MAG: hypothetical protein COT74_02150 [Bdellovibrionales bacterium CG10_big_fil_rev_8_21_14_0_10_45_34]
MNRILRIGGEMQNRVEYQAEIDWIKKKHGNLEEIRAKLAMSKRQVSRLLLVDPSAWSRWVKAGDNAPPHVYRMLDWYLRLEEKDPMLTKMEFDLRKYTESLSQRFFDRKKLEFQEEPSASFDEVSRLNREIDGLKRRTETLQKRSGILLILIGIQLAFGIYILINN